MKILVDADACPKGALAACFALGKQYEVSVYTVANYNHHIASEHHIVVDNGTQQADLKIANLTQSGDVVVTQDWGLAALILGKGAFCLSPGGREYKRETIDFLLEEREAKAKFRRAGNRTRGPKKRTDTEDVLFAQALERLIQAGLTEPSC